MENKVERELARLGGGSYLTGYTYIVEMLEGMLSGNISPKRITEAYGVIAKAHEVTPHAVEQAIRTLITRMWKRREKELRAMFGEYMPTNKQFIGALYREAGEGE